MANVSFEPGDGSFEVTLDEKEPFPTEWNKFGVYVLRADGNGGYYEVKDYQEILTGLETV